MALARLCDLSVAQNRLSRMDNITTVFQNCVNISTFECVQGALTARDARRAVN